MLTLGLNSPPLGWHDPTACLLDEYGRVLAMVEEERPTRRKHGLHRYPNQAIDQCLKISKRSKEDISTVAVGWDLPRHWPRTDRNALDPPLPGRYWAFDDSRDFLTDCLGFRKCDKLPELVFVDHHHAHAASTFYSSDYDEAAILVIDGNGDSESVSLFSGSRGSRIRLLKKLPMPCSLGYFYDAVSTYLGLTFLESGKTMGLASYGRGNAFEEWFQLDKDGSFAPPFVLPNDAEYDPIVDAWHHFLAKEGYSRSTTSSWDLDGDLDAVRLAWSAQANLERVLDHLTEYARNHVGTQNLCLAGGVALNCSANGRIKDPLFVPPVPNDTGIALGAAWSICPPKVTDVLDPYLGRVLENSEVESVSETFGFFPQEMDSTTLVDRIERGEVGAVVSGRAEIGPRALCHRSIIASPVHEDMKLKVNNLKGREAWRPLSPVVLEGSEDNFWTPRESLHRYMIGAAEVTQNCRLQAPAVVHVDATARPQIAMNHSEPISLLLHEMQRRGYPPILINTSFNARGEPIVDSANDVFNAANSISLDYILINDRLYLRR